MNKEHNDINKYIPYGESLRGFADQKFLTSSELNKILRERGIFTSSSDKNYMVPILQTLLLSPKEFDKIRDSFTTKEDNQKKLSRQINFNPNVNISIPSLTNIDISSYIKKNLPTCQLKGSSRITFSRVNNNPNHLKAEFHIIRKDINKVWYQQTNEFYGRIEILNNEQNGRIIITHTAPETKDLATEIAKIQVKEFKKNNLIQSSEDLKGIIFKNFSNKDRFKFFFQLTHHLNSTFFKCESFKDISIKPDEGVLPDAIKWMDNIKKISMSGEALDKKFFIYDTAYHQNLILWKLDVEFSFSYISIQGKIIVSLGFTDYLQKGDNAEFELHINSISCLNPIDPKTKKGLKDKLLEELDSLKSNIFNSFTSEL